MKRGKRYSEAVSILEDDKEYEPIEAIDLAKKAATAKFD